MKGFKFRCFPTATQQQEIRKTFGCCRVVWNQLLSKNIDAKSASIAHLNAQLVALKKHPDYHWLNDVSSVALQQTAVFLSKTFFHLKKAPNFKSKRSRNSFRVVGVESIRLKGKELFLPKDSCSLAIKWTRELPSTPSSYTVTQTQDGKYWVSFTCDGGENRTNTGNGIIGIDLGIKDLVIDSNGVKYSNPKYYKNAQKALAKAQRVFYRRKVGSNRKEKARLQLARKHAKVRNKRKDYIHKLTRKLVNENQVIGFEDLHVRGMMEQGKSMAAAAIDSGLSIFKTYLEYKARESGYTILVKMNRWEPSTHTCNVCGTYVGKKLDLNTREWTCNSCNTLHDRDLNASLNIKRVAEYVLDRYNYPGGSLVLAPPMLHTLSNMPRTVVCAQ